MSKTNLCYLLLLLILLPSSYFLPSVLAKSRNPITDSEIKKKKSECYADIDSGLWGGHCKSSSIAKENCALKCLSPACYELIYESDPVCEIPPCCGALLHLFISSGLMVSSFRIFIL
ncbi:hypothetical protein Godav_000928 [Gossypium davidsonii]|uniref:Uncharacterized protein n=1 Tax=Gossypium davidsonii TaxID=34287 RepID=A0A7J8T1A0_GOSDV|nr:hypothetical protein [Gossypium davidsonii]